MNKILAICLLVFSPLVFGLEVSPYPQGKISLDQWKTYYAEVKKTLSATEKRVEDQGLVTYSDSTKNVHYAFTLDNHPAHPAWISRVIIDKNGELYVKQLGYFAGSEPPFATLFAQYQALNLEMQKWLNEQRNKKNK